MTDNPRPQRKDIRLPDCSYTGDFFFVTICCEQRVHRFRSIYGGEMHLNELGEAAARSLTEIASRYEGTMITDYVVMPDHLHFVIYIDKESPYNLKSLVGVIKTMINHRCLDIFKMTGKEMGRLWQRNYYETIIRNSSHYEEVKAYIVGNPMKWQAESKG